MRVLEACRIRALEGNAYAQGLVDYFASRKYNVGCALLEAAIDAQPGWRRNDDGSFNKDGDAPDEDALLDWYQKTYPSEARAIEDACA
jgi:hypothetical protein